MLHNKRLLVWLQRRRPPARPQKRPESPERQRKLDRRQKHSRRQKGFVKRKKRKP